MEPLPTSNPPEVANLTDYDKSSLTFFAQIPWLTTILTNKSITQRSLSWRNPAASETFFGRTLNTPETIPYFCTFTHQTPNATTQQDTGLIALLQLGPDVAGHSGVAHGGIISTVLDEIMGTSVIAYAESEGINYVTANLSVDYVKPVSVPGAIVVTARLDKREGRKTWITAEVLGVPYGARDGVAVVCARGRALFVKLKSELGQPT